MPPPSSLSVPALRTAVTHNETLNADVLRTACALRRRAYYTRAHSRPLSPFASRISPHPSRLARAFLLPPSFFVIVVSFSFMLSYLRDVHSLKATADSLHSQFYRCFDRIADRSITRYDYVLRGPFHFADPDSHENARLCTRFLADSLPSDLRIPLSRLPSSSRWRRRRSHNRARRARRS